MPFITMIAYRAVIVLLNSSQTRGPFRFAQALTGQNRRAIIYSGLRRLVGGGRVCRPVQSLLNFGMPFAVVENHIVQHSVRHVHLCLDLFRKLHVRRGANLRRLSLPIAWSPRRPGICHLGRVASIDGWDYIPLGEAEQPAAGLDDRLAPMLPSFSAWRRPLALPRRARAIFHRVGEAVWR